MERIGIIGDVHAEHRRLETALRVLKDEQVDVVLCTGDLADGRGDLDACCSMLKDAGVLVVAGNHDRWFLEEKVRHVEGAHFRHLVNASTVHFIAGLPRTRSVHTAFGEVILCHGVLDNDLAKIWPGSENTSCRRSSELDLLLLQRQPPRFFINGHMHFRTVVDFAATQMINAGTLKGQFAGFCCLDLREGALQSFNFDEQGRAELVCRFNLTARNDRRIWCNTEEFDGVWEPVILHRPAC